MDSETVLLPALTKLPLQLSVLPRLVHCRCCRAAKYGQPVSAFVELPEWLRTRYSYIGLSLCQGSVTTTVPLSSDWGCANQMAGVANGYCSIVVPVSCETVLTV